MYKDKLLELIYAIRKLDTILDANSGAAPALAPSLTSGWLKRDIFKPLTVRFLFNYPNRLLLNQREFARVHLS